MLRYKINGETIREKKTQEEFQPPKKTNGFRKYWDVFIEDMKDRPNLKKSHLLQLEILCDLCIEKDILQKFVDRHGHSWSQTGGRYGDQEKLRPEVGQLSRVIAQIKDYCVMLGLTPLKSPKRTPTKEEEAIWE